VHGGSKGGPASAERGVSLPLGRHSIMNGIAIPLHGSKVMQDRAIKLTIAGF